MEAIQQSFSRKKTLTEGDRPYGFKAGTEHSGYVSEHGRKDKSPITIYLVSGVKLTGKIRSFDKYSVLLENNSQEQLIFKHAISTVVSGRAGAHTELRSESREARPAPHAAAPVSAAAHDATGTQGH